MFLFGFVLGTPNSDISNKNTNSTDYQNETVEPTYFSSSIHYGGCEDYFSEGSTIEPRHVVSIVIIIACKLNFMLRILCNELPS